VREREADEAILSAGHVLAHPIRDRFRRRVPLEVERLLGRLTVAVDRHHVGEAHGVVAWIVEPADLGAREVLGDGER
jgi:hypothetical protein